jgi:hypothetical protein
MKRLFHYSHQWSAHQASCLATIIFRLVDVFPMKIIRGVTFERLNHFFEAMIYLTCLFFDKAASVPKVSLISVHPQFLLK